MASMLRSRRLLPRSPFSGFGLRSSSRCRCASLRCAARSALTFSYSRPSETVASVLIPTSTPMVSPVATSPVYSSSTWTDTYQRPSFSHTVARLIFSAAVGKYPFSWSLTQPMP